MNENNLQTDMSLFSVLNKTSFFILLLVTFLVPIFFLPVSFISTQFGTSLLFAFGVIVSIIMYVVSTLSSGSVDLPESPKYKLGLLVLVPLVYSLAGVANGFSRMSFFGYTFDISTAGFMLLGFAYLFLVSVLFRDKARIFYSYVAFGLSSLVISIFLLVRIFFGVKILSFGLFNSLTSTIIGSWNNVGIFFGVSIVLLMIAHQTLSVSRFVKILIYLFTSVSVFFVALVNFKLVWITLSVFCFLFILYTIFNSNENQSISVLKRFLKVPLYPLFILVICLVVVFGNQNIGLYFSNKFHITNVEIRPSLSATLDIARNTITSKPLFGSGPNTFINQWLVWKPSDILSTVFWNLDFNNGIGLIPTFVVTTGLIGTISWILFLSYYLYIGFRSVFVKVDDQILRYLITSSFFTSLYLWVISFCYMPSTVVFIITLFFTGLFFASIYCSGIIKIETRLFSTNQKVGFLSSLVLVVVFISSIVLGYGLYQNSKSLWYFQKSSYALNTENKPDLSEEYMNKAISLVPYDVYYRALAEIDLVKLNSVVRQDANKIKAEDLQKQFNDVLAKAIIAGQNAQKADPANYLNWVSLGRVYEAVSSPALKIKGTYESSQLAYTEAFRRSPKNPAIPVVLSGLALSHNDLDKAKDYALQAIQIKNNYLDAYFVLSQIEVASGNISGAIEAVTASSIIDPTNPATFFQLGLLRYNQADYNNAIIAFEKAISIAKDYANAKYFLGLSYEITNQHEKAIKEFNDLKLTNPDSKDVSIILDNLLAGKPLFTNSENKKPEKGKNLPVKEKQ